VTTIGILALQGDFIEHEASFRGLGVSTRQVRLPEHLRGLDGLVLPGGESTTFCRLMAGFNLFEPLRAFVRTGAPVWGTCAGMIVLANHASDLDFPTLEAIDITVLRNAYGRQVDSFEKDIDIPALRGGPFHGVFIRAPVVESIGPATEVLASVRDDKTGEERPVAVRQRHIMATSFHPELTSDSRLHAYFLDMVGESAGSSSPK